MRPLGQPNQSRWKNGKTRNSFHQQVPQTAAKTTFVMDIPASAVGWIIGRSGSQIKAIQRETHCAVWVDQDVPNDHPRKVFFQGSKCNVAVAVARVEKLIIEAPMSCSEFTCAVKDCPSDFIGMLIGKDGARIQRIRLNSGANLSLNQSVRENVPKKIIISGTPDRVGVAIALVDEALVEHFASVAPVQDGQVGAPLHSTASHFGSGLSQTSSAQISMNMKGTKQSLISFEDSSFSLLSPLISSGSIGSFVDCPPYHPEHVIKSLHQTVDNPFDLCQSLDKSPDLLAELLADQVVEYLENPSVVDFVSDQRDDSDIN